MHSFPDLEAGGITAFKNSPKRDCGHIPNGWDKTIPNEKE
jgi:hypothetical protein